MNRLAVIISAVAVCVALGFAAGYYTKGQFAEAQVVEQARGDLKQSAANVVQAIETNQKVEMAVAQSSQAVTQIQQAVAKRPKLVKPASKPQPKPEKPNEEAPSLAAPAAASCDAYELDTGTVRLLNAARKGADLDTVAGSDEALAAPSGITVDRLLQNDLEVVKLYRDLAKRHDELVTEVEEKLKQQAE